MDCLLNRTLILYSFSSYLSHQYPFRSVLFTTSNTSSTPVVLIILCPYRSRVPCGVSSTQYMGSRQYQTRMSGVSKNIPDSPGYLYACSSCPGMSLPLAVFTGRSSLVSFICRTFLILTGRGPLVLILLVHSILCGCPAILSAGFSAFPAYFSHMSTIRTYSFSSLPGNRTLLFLVHRSETPIRRSALSLILSLCHSYRFIEY